MKGKKNIYIIKKTIKHYNTIWMKCFLGWFHSMFFCEMSKSLCSCRISKILQKVMKTQICYCLRQKILQKKASTSNFYFFIFYFFIWSPLVRRHLFDHHLWSLFQSSFTILHITNHAGPSVWADNFRINEAFTIIILLLFLS